MGRREWCAILCCMMMVVKAIELKYGFSECDVENKRTLYYYYPNISLTKEQLCSTNESSLANKLVIKPPVNNLRCDVLCRRGYFLGANFNGTVPISACEKCPEGTYSIGGGMLFSHMTNAWTTPLPNNVFTECLSQSSYSGTWHRNCNAWSAVGNSNKTSSGLMLSSGVGNSDILHKFMARRLVSILRLNLVFVRPNGSITFTYKVDAEDPYDGLVFLMDTSVKMRKVSDTDGEFKEFTLNAGISVGSHLFSWEYMKDYGGDEGLDQAFIKVIEVQGTSFSDIKCHACGGEMTSSGGSLCKFCDANEYAGPTSDSVLSYTCHKCPPHSYSPKGSIGIEGCLPKRPCDANDYTVDHHSACDPQTHLYTPVYKWIQPQTCNTSLPGSVQLPVNVQSVSCDTCLFGYYSQDGNCIPCPIGSYLAQNSTCVKCRTNGEIPQNKLIYGKYSNPQFKWQQQKWPFFIPTSTSSEQWSVIKDGIIHGKNRHKFKEGRVSLFVNMTFVTTGYFNFTYIIESMQGADKNGSLLAMFHRKPLSLTSNENSILESAKINLYPPSNRNAKDFHVASYSRLINTTGVHIFEFVWEVSSIAQDRVMSLKFDQFNFSGALVGAASHCVSCPHGFIAHKNLCKSCSAGTFYKVNGMSRECSNCTRNSYSTEGASTCQPCGNNTFSFPGSSYCNAPSELTLKSSLSPAMITYNLSQLQYSATQAFLDGSLRTQNVSKIYPVDPFGRNNFAFGIFRRINLNKIEQTLSKNKMKVDVTIVNKVIMRTPLDWPYVMGLISENYNEAGHLFKYKAGVYGAVQCQVPYKYKMINCGSRLNIVANPDNSGISVNYGNGSSCKERDGTLSHYTTTIHYECDPKADDRTSKPIVEVAGLCSTVLRWKMKEACPICQPSFFTIVRSECVNGEQTIHYQNTLPCSQTNFGELNTRKYFSYNQTKTSGCKQIVLSQKAVYTGYAVIVSISGIFFLLLGIIYSTNRKYNNTYESYMYLKGQMNGANKSNQSVTRNGDETIFEFGDQNTNIASATAAVDTSSGSCTDDDQIELTLFDGEKSN